MKVKDLIELLSAPSVDKDSEVVLTVEYPNNITSNTALTEVNKHADSNELELVVTVLTEERK